MLWIEKYKPKSFEEFKSHDEITSVLNKYTLETIPNLIIHGQTGHNKKTTLCALISKLYGKYPQPIQKTIEVEVGASKIDVNYLESEEMIEVCPSTFGYKDRYVVQNLIKDMAQNRPILSLFGAKKRSMKILVIDQAEDLSKDAQAALRRTMEVYSGHFRIIMLCTETSKLIDPIRSRCLQVRMRGFKDEEIKVIYKDIADKEGVDVQNDVLDEVCRNSEGNIKRALCILELISYNQLSNEKKKAKTDYNQFKLEWESKIDSIVEMIKASPKPDTLLEIRKELYNLLISQISPSVILVRIMKGICRKLSLNACKSAIAFALGYEERIRLGNKPIYHLEAFVASLMLIQSQK